jgi:hypothetical protein
MSAWKWLALGLMGLALQSAAEGQDRRTLGLDVDLSGGKFDKDKLWLTRPKAEHLLQPSADGLRVAIPAGKGEDEICLDPHVSLPGDFEITATYEILKLDEPDAGYGVGPCIYILTASADNRAALISRYKRPNEGDVYCAFRAKDTDDSHDPRLKRLQLIPTTSQAGRLCLKRTATTLYYLVAEGADEDFRQLVAWPFGDAPVKLIHFAVKREGAQSAVEVVWKDLHVHAGKETK